MHSHNLFDSLLIVVIAAVVIPVLVEKIKIIKVPVVVGEIVAGIIIGESGFGLINLDSTLEFLSVFGFTYLMFLSGLEIDFDSLSLMATNRKVSFWKSPAVLGTLIFVLTILGSLTFSYFLSSFGFNVNTILLALILSTTSLGIVVPTLKEAGIASSRLGQTILFSALIADFVTMLLITALVTFITPGPTHEILLVIILFIVFVILYAIFKYVRYKRIFDEFSVETAQIQVRGAFALILAFIVLSHQLGVEIILGAFLAGAFVSITTHRGSILYDKLEAIGYGFFVPIFFIMVGVQFDLSVLVNGKSNVSPTIVIFLLAGAFLVKFLPSLILRVQYTWREAVSAGALLSSRLSLIIAASAIGLNLGLIDNATNSVIILIALITCTVSPIIFKKLYHTEDQRQYKRICIFGASEPAFLLANRLVDNDYHVRIIDEKKRKPGKIIDKRVEWFEVDWDDPQVLSKIHPEEAETVVVASPDESLNERITSQLAHQYKIKNVVSLIENPEIATHFREEGIKTLSPKLSTFLMLKNLVMYPRAFELLLEEENLYIKEVELRNKFYHGNTLKEIEFPGNCLVISIIRNDEKIFPYANRKLKLGDRIVLIGDKMSVEKAVNMF